MDKELAVKIDEMLEGKQRDPSMLVGLLLEIQDIIPKQYIPTEVAVYVSEGLGIPLSKVYDVISFYAALSETPRADYVIQVCDSVVCKVVGNTLLKETLEGALGIKIGEITEDGKFALCHTPCFGACDIAPAIRLNGKVFGNLTSEEKIKEVVAGCF